MASFYWDGWRVDFSLNFFILAALATGFALMTAVQAVNALIGLPARAREWRLLRLERAAQAALREALGRVVCRPLWPRAQGGAARHHHPGRPRGRGRRP
jgi:HemY protein